MKKRRELDALVNGKLGRNKKKKGQHELLRNSESSDVEEFAIPSKPVRIRKHSRSSRLCATCISACGFFLLLACVIAVVGLVWVHLELKKDVDFLRSQLQKVESGSANNPDEFQELHRKQQELEESIKRITSGKNGIEAQAQNISSIFQQLKVLNQTTKGLSKSLDAAPTLEELPNRVENLAQQVAGFGSEIETLKHSIEALETFQTNTEKELADLQASASTENRESQREGLDIPAAILQINEEITNLNTKIDALNNTASKKYLEVREQFDKYTRDLQRLNTSLLNIDSQLKQLQSLPTSAPGEVPETASQVQELISSAIEQLRQTTATKEDLLILQNQVRNISSSLQLISNQYDSSTGEASDTAGLQKLREDLDQCCTGCAESIKSLNSSLADLRTQLMTTQPSDNNGGKGKSTTTTLSVLAANANSPLPTSEVKIVDEEQISTESPLKEKSQETGGGPKVAARDLHRARARDREGNQDHQDEVSEMLKKAIQESGNH